ncbi:MAG: hypothetical protein WD767_16870 [Alphaproteobacteria bacterium]
MATTRIFVLVFLTLLALTRTGQAADVPVRGWAHAEYGRIVFDWPAPVNYSAAIADRQLAVRFDQPISGRFDEVREYLQDYIGNVAVSADGRVARFALTGDFSLRTFKNGNSVVVDLLRNPDGQSRTVPPLGIRIGEHPNYTRLVFDWNSAVTYSAELSGPNLLVRFNRPARLDLDAIRRDLPPGIVNPAAQDAGNGVAFSLDVPGNSRLRHFRSGTKVVVDILAEPAEKPSPAAPAAAAAPVRRAQASAVPAPVPAAPDAPAAPEKAPAAEPVQPAPTAAVGPRRLLPDSQEKEHAAGRESGTATAAAAPHEAASPDQSLQEQAQASGGVAAETPAVAASEAPQQHEAEARQLVQDAFAAAKSDAPIGASVAASVSMVFEWPEPVGAAVFARAGHVWIVFDSRAPLDLAPLRAAGRGLISRLEQLPVGNASVLRMVANENLSPFARRDGTNWVIEFREGRIRPEIQIPIEVRTGGNNGPELFFPAIEAGNIYQIPDPEVGDMIMVATVQASSQGIAGQRAYPQFQILASTQGVAVVPLSDDLELARADDGLILSLAGGLHVSGVSPDGGQEAGNAAGERARRIFNISEWMQGDAENYYNLRQKLQDEITQLPRERRNTGRMKLAQFYFARTLAPEAKGVLEVAESVDERAAVQPEFKALKGAIAILHGDVDEAARNLNDPRLDKYEEIQLWRGLVAAAVGNDKQASLLFQNGEAVLHGYPEPMKSRLALIVVDAALNARDPGAASRWLNEISKKTDHMTRGQRATMQYLQGRVAFVNRDLNRAMELWTELQKSGDAWNAARAALSLVNLGLLQETMPIDEAISRLEDLRYRWRGDEFELDVLRRLGGLYLDKDDYRNGLGIYRVIATYFPDHPDTKRIAQIMTDTFKELYLEGKADTLPPLTALALYDEFRELTPAGPDGNVMIQKLAERLVDVDLLKRAADLLEHQVKFRLQGEERAVVGAKLALIRLLDRDPKAAIEALRTTAYSRLPEELDDDRRRIQARAYFETGRVQEAVELLAGDVSRNADLLRADIQWKSENWPEAAKALQRFAGEPPAEGTTYDRADAQVVLNWAVALRLSRDESGLSVLRELYGSAMEASPLANAFQFIASPSGADEPLDIENVTGRIAETDMFDAFLAEYLEDNKRRLLKSNTAPPAPGPAAPDTAAPAATPQATRPAAAPPVSG